MKISKSRKWIALVLSALLLIPSFSLASASSSSDISGHWAETNLQEWVEQGLLEGFEANVYKPNKDVTRAEFMTFINRAFGLTGTAALNYKDVQTSTNKWYVKEIGKAVQAGYVKGYEDNTIRPNDQITRQEAAVMLSNLVKGSEASSADLSGFSDADKIAAWAKDSVAKVFDLGYIGGYPNKTLKPQNKITRAESVVMINRAMEDQFTIYKKAGTYGVETGQDTIAGDVMITVANVTLKNTIIEGNLILGKGIGEGDVTLDNVTVKGNTIIQGGGVNSIHIINSSLFTIIVDKATGVVRIVASGTTAVGSVIAKTPAIFVENELTGTGFGNITITEQGNGQIELSGNFDKVIVEVPGITVNVVNGTVNTLEVTAAAANTTINLSANTTVTNLNINAATDVKGTGTVVNANITANGVSLEKRPTNLIVSPGITVIVPDAPVVDNGSSTPSTPSTSRDVSTEIQLLAALADSKIKTINVKQGFIASKTIVIDRAITLNGNDKEISLAGALNGTEPAEKHGVLIQSSNVTINNLKVKLDKVGDDPAWGGNYGIQVYDATGVTLNNVTVSGADAGILVNASTVTLKGTTDVSGNEFGGIEVSKGTDVTRDSVLTVGVAATLLNTTESESQPTIWVENGKGFVEGWNTQLIKTDVEDKDQTFYLLNVYNETQLRTAAAQEGLKIISLGDVIELTSSLVINRENVTLDGNSSDGLEIGIGFNNLSTNEKPDTSGLIIQANGVTVTDLILVSFDSEEEHDPSIWASSYGIQVYNAENVTLNNIIVAEFNAGILVNSSEVELTGELLLAGNGFGGIEVSRGEGLDRNSVLTLSGTILNEEETEDRPTIWVTREADGEKDQGTVVGWNTQLIEAEGTGDDPQTFYYLNVYNELQLRTAVDQVGLKNISVAGYIYLTSPLVINREDVTLTADEPWYGIEFYNLDKRDDQNNLINPNPSGIIIQANGVTVTDLWISYGYTEGSTTDWFGSYGIQVYNATGVTLKNLDIESFNAAILVNASEVELDGVLYLWGNGFGGIEVSRGTGMSRDSVLNLTATIVNGSESAETPTVWVVYDPDGVTPQGTFTNTNEANVFTEVEKKDGDKITQVYYHLPAPIIP
ncbi:S-layer homology domain-containing protein [Paenibacillus endoradicis]|uniref:S-layer homology domain-containing protein n=1 Tax=Paenibacillus endoradicis TaxID=2972487 RepID=UPI00215931BF|nr:S-layer homology domain-containing protein [Paenibacillus endoradicis]MCR8657086.1 S-layer homology domain-containing protein [Paenibacillus endoradicis]